MALLFGYDIGSSSIKATLIEAESGKVLASATVPDREMEIIAKKPGWAEQHPQTWWKMLPPRKNSADNFNAATSVSNRIRCTGWDR
jgi:ribulose kinase